MANNRMNVRTDMACELKQRFPGEVPGVRYGIENNSGMEVFSVDIFIIAFE